MPVLTWKHGRSRDDATAAIKAALAESGHDGAVKWSGATAEARCGPFASIVHAKGVVTDDAVVIEKCGGVAGGPVLTRCRELFTRLFPGGEQPN